MSPPIRYALIGEKLMQIAPNGDILKDITEESLGKNLDPEIFALVLRNLGKEMTLGNWNYRMAYFLCERLDIRLRGNHASISSDTQRKSEHPSETRFRNQEGSTRGASDTPNGGTLDGGLDSRPAQDLQGLDKAGEPDKTSSKAPTGDDVP